MKRRLFNTFVRVTKNGSIAKLLANIGYATLLCAYYIIRLFLKGKSTLSIDKAREVLNSTSKKPNMSTDIHYNEPKKSLSIIVPTFNAEATIGQCIDSVINQKTKFDYELVIINDGSTDKTREVVEQYEDNHISLINQDNRGFSGARNRGIDECVGQYIMFLDSDDYLVGNCIENMMDNITQNDADIVQASHFSFFEGSDNKRYEILEDKVIENDTFEMICNPGYPWAKIYRRELFSKIRFPLDVLFEDTIVSMILFRICKKVSVMSDVVYAYRINPSGITKNVRNSKKCIDHYWVMEYCLEQAKKMELPNDDVQYNIVKKHLSSFMYRRMGKMDNNIKESAFILAADMLDKIRPAEYKCEGNIVEKDIEKSFINRNYKLWKVSSFVV